jgi:hypothetical protein
MAMRMRLPKNILFVVAAGALTLGVAFDASLAARTIPQLESSSILLLVTHKEHCGKACFKKKGEPKVCQTFCGKGHHDMCEDFEDGKIKPTPKLEDHPCYPICKDTCEKTRGSLTWEQCLTDCLNRTRC